MNVTILVGGIDNGYIGYYLVAKVFKLLEDEISAFCYEQKD